MTPQEKAKELMSQFLAIPSEEPCFIISYNQCKIACNILCDEMINSVAFDNHRTKRKFLHCSDYPDYCFASYWEEVKTENNK